MSEINFDSLRLNQKWIGTAVAVLLLLILLSGASFIIEPGHRGVLVTLGKVSPAAADEGLGLKMPFITSVIQTSIRQQTRGAKAECYSSDLQQVMIDMKILYRIPPESVVRIFQDYSGDPFESLIVPRVAEAVKEVTAMQSAEQIVKKREEIKAKALALAKTKISSILVLEDLVLADVSLSRELEQAIEAKMVQEQEAAKAKFTQQKAEIEASTAIIKAKGEAEAIRVRGKALEQSPGLVQLQIVEKWDGVAPLVVSGSTGGGANFILPLDKMKAK
jgi:prohibitin 2